ncbi:hypothetical protein A2V94_01040 [Candidatus Atribacteria bacterium RBG_16_35_8]|nr:MAG: hypothetical protein A2V94_01040 [Candidatus Atribacteria bacterium RBG_16_35_8]
MWLYYFLVIPAEAGIQKKQRDIDSCFRRNDKKEAKSISLFFKYIDSIKVWEWEYNRLKSYEFYNINLLFRL